MNLLEKEHDFVRRHWRGTCRTPRAFVPLQGRGWDLANSPGIQGAAQGCPVELVPGRACLGGYGLHPGDPWAPRHLQVV